MNAARKTTTVFFYLNIIFFSELDNDKKTMENKEHARPPAIAILEADVPWLVDEGKNAVVAPPANIQASKVLYREDKQKPLPGIVSLKDGEDLYDALYNLDLMYSMSNGTHCLGRVVDQGMLGVITYKGHVKFAKPGQWMFWSCHTTWADPPTLPLNSSLLTVNGVSIVTLNQRECIVAQDRDGRSHLLSGGRFIVMAPAVLCGNVISLVDLPKRLHVQRFNFFNVPQGEVCGVTLPSGQVRILLPGVHIVEDCKFERFLPTVPIQSKLKKDVVTSDLVTVSLEVDIATQLIDCARFLKMSAGAVHTDAHGRQQLGVGCKDLYDAIEETAQSHFVDTFGKTQYYSFRTKQGEVESKFEETALQILDREARKYGGRILKVNILKQRADAVEAVYAAHNSKQVELEQKKQSQQRQYDIDENDQKHRQVMAEREEKNLAQKQQLAQERDSLHRQYAFKLQLAESKAAQEKLDFEAKATLDREAQKQQLTQERELQYKQHTLRLQLAETKAMQDKLDFEAKTAWEREAQQKQHVLKLQLAEAKTAQDKLDLEVKAGLERQKLQLAESRTTQERLDFETKATLERQKIQLEGEKLKKRVYAEVEADALLVTSAAQAKAAEQQKKQKLDAMQQMATIFKDHPAAFEFEKQRLSDEQQVAKVKAVVDAGGRVVPIELMRVMDIADERALKRLENQVVLQMAGVRSAHAQQHQRQEEERKG